MKRKRLLAAVTAAALTVSVMPFSVIAADSDEIAINETNFPDENFREFIERDFDLDENHKLSADEIAEATEMYANGEGIEDLTGINYFTELTILNCSGCDLTSLDVSNNKKLTELICTDNQLTSLDVSKNTKLTDLDCDNNQIRSINLSKNTNLESLSINGNPIISLDLSKTNIDDFSSNSFLYEMNETVISYDDFISKLKKYDPSFDESKVEWTWNIDNDDHTFEEDDAETYQVSYTYNCGKEDISIDVDVYIDRIYIGKGAAVSINEANFPDEAFRNYISEELDDDDGILYGFEIEEATDIDVSDLGIKSLAGIEYFTSLETLDISNNPIISLDLIANTFVISVTDDNISYTITDEIRTYEGLIAALKAYDSYFDESKVTWETGVDNETHEFASNSGSLEVTYTYDCGNSITIQPVITIENLGLPAEKPEKVTLSVNDSNAVTLTKSSHESETVPVTGFDKIDTESAEGDVSWTIDTQYKNLAELTVAVGSDNKLFEAEFVGSFPTDNFESAGTQYLTIKIVDGANITENITGDVNIYLKDITDYTFAEGTIHVYIEPADDDKDPDTGDKDPDTGDKDPDTGDKDPDTGDKDPDTGDKDPDTGDKDPDTGDKDPDTGDKDPDTGDNVPDYPSTTPPSSDDTDSPSLNLSPQYPNIVPSSMAADPTAEALEAINELIDRVENGSYDNYWDFGDDNTERHAKISLKGNTQVPKEVISAIEGHDITIEFELSGGVSWEINGLDIERSRYVNLGVRMNSKRVSKEAIETFADDRKTIQFYLKHRGKLGFNATLNIPVNKKYNGMYANLYYYKDGEFVFVESALVSGSAANFALSHAYDDYIIVLDDHAYYTDGTFIV